MREESHFRFVITAMLVVSTINAYLCRLNLSTAIVKMAKEGVSQANNSAVFEGLNGTTITPETENLRWSEDQQDTILGAFFWGYFALQAVGGRLAEIFGPRILCSIGLFVSGLINVLTPVIANWNDPVFIASRVILGMFQATVFPSAYAVVANWIPDTEKSTVLALTTIGSCLGSVISSSLTGILCEHAGWPSVFYVSGIQSLVFSIIFYLVVRNHPSESGMVSQKELKYIRKSVPTKESIGTARRSSTPWTKILLCIPLWVTIIAKFSNIWTFNLVSLKVPAYMDQVLHISLEKNGYFSSVFYIGDALGLLTGGLASDRMIKRNVMTKTKIRKLFECLGTFGAAIFTALVPLLKTSGESLFLALMFGTAFFLGLEAGGEAPIYPDLSAQFSATLFGIANMVTMSSGFLSPYIVGTILDSDHSNPASQWAIIFYLTSGLNAIGGLMFMLFASAERQEWG